MMSTCPNTGDILLDHLVNVIAVLLTCLITDPQRGEIAYLQCLPIFSVNASIMACFKLPM